MPTFTGKKLKGWYLVVTGSSLGPDGRYLKNPPVEFKPYLRKLTAEEGRAAAVLYGTDGQDFRS